MYVQRREIQGRDPKSVENKPLKPVSTGLKLKFEAEV
jgi:hypothetical protein